MPGDAELVTSRLIRQAYCPNAELSDWLPSLLKETMAAANSQHCEVRLKSRASSLTSHRDEILLIDPNGARAITGQITEENCSVCGPFTINGRADPVILNDSAIDTRCGSVTLLPGSSVITPILYQGTLIGLMTLGSGTGHNLDQAELCRLIARSIAYHSQRYELRNLVMTNLGRDCMLIGTSKELARIDEFVEKASRVDCPVMVLGELGTEKKRIAYALHFAGPRRHSPFVEIICSTLDRLSFKSQLRDLFDQGDNGAIFFNGLDELKEDLQGRLVEFLETESVQCARKNKNKEAGNTRLVASVSKPLDALVKEGGVSRSLTWQFDFLEVSISPLRDRKEDIRPLLQFFAEKYSVGSPPEFSREVLELCESYNWPGNNREMERTVARLVAFSEGETIKADDLIRHAPHLVDSVRKMGTGTVRARRSAGGDREKITRRQIDSGLVNLARSLIREDLVGLTVFHPAITKALIYLARNLTENISIRQLAAHACVSSSHLSYLFQKTLRANFKLFLALVRIEKAKALLLQNPNASITNVSSEVGFGELRHFERTFKDLVGQTPREYRREAGEDQLAEWLGSPLPAQETE